MTAKDRYLLADACYQKLRKNEKKMKYRDNWLRCIDKYTAVYTFDPEGPWAAAGLYRSGELYQELYKRSFLGADKREALDIFERVVKRYPASAYKKKSLVAIQSFTVSKPTQSSLAKKPDHQERFIQAETCYQRLRNSPTKMKYRDQWIACIDQFKAVYEDDKDGPWAAAGLFKTGELYRELFKHSYRAADKQASLNIFERVVREYPDSAYNQKAQEAIRIFPNSGSKVVQEQRYKPEGNAVQQTEKAEEPGIDSIAAVIEEEYRAEKMPSQTEPLPAAEGFSTVTGLRFWSNPNYTRVVIDVDNDTEFLHKLLKEDPSIDKPERLFVDLEKAKLGKDTSKVIPIDDNLLSDVRAGQYTLDSVRVVIDIKSFKHYKIFSLKNPFRIVIDVWGRTPKTASQTKTDEKKSFKSADLGTSALARQLALGVSRIVIDPGHGGRDFGAPGYLKGVHEKYLVLSIAKRLAKKIEKQLNCEVIMTRTTDIHLTLEERTAIANMNNADLFISIHTNSARDRRAYGLETYFLNLATDDEAIMVAARENATSRKNISDLQTILNDLMHNAKVNESSRLAAYVQDAMYAEMKNKYSRIKNKGVKQAPFYVLLGAQMPSILIETSFISNSRECRRLKDPRYQDLLCEGIINGIRKYIRETNPTAFSIPSQRQRSSG